ncbi:MAG: NAD(P)-dependent oxidoreductase [Alphaproteobacteria bacterium]|nr:NAD(P)-dependent oxidoreductase [Alphaproteobacteria bacterium]
MSQKVGLVGLGSIGHPLAVNMIAKGLEVHGFRRSSMAEFEKAGGKPAASPKAIAEQCDIIAMVLPGEDETEDVLFGANGILASGRKGLVIIDLSTYALADKEGYAKRVAAAGSCMIDAPLSGVPSMVAARNGIIFASGEKSAYEASKHVFDAMSDKAFYLGKFGDGLKMKFIANTLVSIHILAAAEALALGVKAGLDRDTMVKVLSPSAGTSLQFQVRAPLMMKKQYEPVMAPTSILSKDVPMFVEFAKAMGASTPLLEVAEQFYTRALGTPWENKDVASIIELYAQDNGITI